MWNREPIGGAFTLVDQNGKVRTDADFRGKIMLVYFGFTFCPDICPTDLWQMARAVDALGGEGERVQPIFVTVDPERDTPAHLAQYMALFHPRFVGLTGEAKAVRKTAQAYRVYFKKAPADNAEGYTIDHSAFIFVIGRSGEYLGFLPSGTTAERLVEIIRPLVHAEP